MIYIIIYFYVFIILTILSYIDIKTKIVPNKYCLMIFIAGIINIFIDRDIIFHLKGLILMMTLNIIIAIASKGLGGGDVKLFSSLGFVLGWEISFQIYTISFLFSGLFIILIKICPLKNDIIDRIKISKEIPFVPFINSAFILIFIENLLY